MKRPRPAKRNDGFKNNLERDYAKKLSDDPEVIRWRYEPMSLRIGRGATYKPDFLVTKIGHCEFHETKGRWREAARVRIKCAADQYPEFLFIAVQRIRKEWIYEQF